MKEKKFDNFCKYQSSEYRKTGSCHVRRACVAYASSKSFGDHARTRVLPRDTKSKKESKDQESIQSSTTPGPGYHWESDNN